MGSAYLTNPDLNAARAEMRAIDEGVPQARSTYRPRITATGDYGFTTTRSLLAPRWSTASNPRGYGISVEQPLFLGFRTKNAIKQAESSVRAAREQLKVIEQDTLLSAVTAFMNVIRAQVLVNLTAQNIKFLREQVSAAQDRLSVGEGTRTDVAETESSLSAGLSDYAAAVANLNEAIAIYVQVIGHKPESLGSVNGIDKHIPSTLDQALDIALSKHPAIVSSLYNIDVASYNVRVAEGQLLPSASISGSWNHRDNNSFKGNWNESASITGQISVPIYQGGEYASQIRELKERLGQRRIELDVSRAQIRQQVISAWGTLDAARAQVEAAAARVTAQQLVLSGVIEERRVGQRTTLDVLDAQQDLLDAQVSQVTAQRDRVVAAYAVVSAVGRLNAAQIGLDVPVYDPTEHYDEVKDKWLGLRTPDGR